MKLQTGRLTLRTVSMKDSLEVARMWNFENGEISIEEARKAIIWMNANHKKNRLHRITHLCLAIFEKNRDKIIGWCGLDGGYGNNKDKNRIVIFYLIDKDYRRKGYATECAEKLLEYGFLKLKVNRIDGGCAIDNIGSKKVLENIGMRNMKIIKGNSYDYHLTYEEYTHMIKQKI